VLLKVFPPVNGLLSPIGLVAPINRILPGVRRTGQVLPKEMPVTASVLQADLFFPTVPDTLPTIVVVGAPCHLTRAGRPGSLTTCGDHRDHHRHQKQVLHSVSPSRGGSE